MYRSTTRLAPYNLFVHLNEVATAAKLKKAATPPDYFSWGTEKDFPKGPKATTIAAQFCAAAVVLVEPLRSVLAGDVEVAGQRLRRSSRRR